MKKFVTFLGFSVLSFFMITYTSVAQESNDKIPNPLVRPMPEPDTSTQTAVAIRSICDQPQKILSVIEGYDEIKLFDAFGMTFVVPPNMPPRYARQLNGIASMYVNSNTGTYSIIFSGEGFSCLILNGNKFTPGGMDQ